MLQGGSVTVVKCQLSEISEDVPCGSECHMVGLWVDVMSRQPNALSKFRRYSGEKNVKNDNCKKKSIVGGPSPNKDLP